MAAPVGVVQFRFDARRAEGYTFEQFSSGRGRNRHQAVGTFHHAVAGRNRPAREMLDSEEIETNRGAGNVGDTVQCPHFMEMDLFNGNSVCRCFRLGQALKNAHGQIPLRLRQAATGEDLLDFG